MQDSWMDGRWSEKESFSPDRPPFLASAIGPVSSGTWHIVTVSIAVYGHVRFIGWQVRLKRVLWGKEDELFVAYNKKIWTKTLSTAPSLRYHLSYYRTMALRLLYWGSQFYGLPSIYSFDNYISDTHSSSMLFQPNIYPNSSPKDQKFTTRSLQNVSSQ